ncbi:hypothetical protein GA0115260_1004912, partial [Streptomyces sp. MnatMP-M27]
ATVRSRPSSPYRQRLWYVSEGDLTQNPNRSCCVLTWAFAVESR